MLESFKNIWKLRQEARRLRRVRTLDCNVASLRAANCIRLGDVFHSSEIDEAWQKAAATLGKFDLPDGTGGVNPGDRRAIFYLVSYFEARSVLEIGTHIGASTVHIAAALDSRRNAAFEDGPPHVSVDAVDVNDPVARPWLRYGATISPADMVRRMGCSDVTEFVTSSSLEYMRNCKRRFDFIFLDGDHTASVVYREMRLKSYPSVD